MGKSKEFIIITVRDTESATYQGAHLRDMPKNSYMDFDNDCACPVDDLLLISKVDQQFSELDYDCACPSDGLSIENPSTSVNKNKLFVLSPLHTSTLMNGYEMVFNPLSQSGVVALNPPAMSLLKSFAQPQSLVKGAQSTHDPVDALVAVQELAALNLIQPVGSSLELRRTPPKTLTAWLHLTNECNLRCDYCYLHKTKESMSLERGYQSVDAVFRSAVAQSFRQVKLKYAGGESTLEFDLILQLHDYAREQADKLGMGLSGVVLSNGIGIGDQQIKSLQTRNIRLSISVDGIGEYHDAQRKFQNGKGSFSLVERSLDRLAHHAFKPTITITVSRRNLNGLSDAVQYLLDRGLPFTVNFYRENEQSGSFEDLVYQDEQMIEAMQKAFVVIENNLPPFSVLGTITDRARLDAPHLQPCGVGHSYMVIDQDGNVAKCHMEIQHKITNVYAADPLKVLQLDKTGIQNHSVEEKEACRTCEWRYYCAGGCPALTYRVTGRHDVKSPNCRIYKALFPEVLRLEGLRILKYAQRLSSIIH